MALLAGFTQSPSFLLTIAEEWEEAIRLACVSDFDAADRTFKKLKKRLGEPNDSDNNNDQLQKTSKIQKEFDSIKHRLTASVFVAAPPSRSASQVSGPKSTAKLYFNIGQLRSSLGDDFEAIFAFKSAIINDGHCPLNWFALGIEQFDTKDFQGAQEAFEISKKLFEAQSIRVRLKTYEMARQPSLDLLASPKEILKSKWNVCRSQAVKNAETAGEALLKPNAGLELHHRLPKNGFHGPIKDPTDNGEIEKKKADAARLRTHLTQAIEAENRAKTGIVRSMSEGSGSRSKPLPRLPGDTTPRSASTFASSDEDAELNPSSVYTSLHTSAKLISPYDSHTVKKETEEDWAGLPGSKRHTTPNDLKVQIPRGSSLAGQATPYSKPSPSTATTTNTFCSTVFSSRANSLANAEFTFTPPTQTHLDGLPTSIKTSFNLSPPKVPSLITKSYTTPFRGPEPPYQNSVIKAQIRPHPTPKGPGQWLWKPDVYPPGFRQAAVGEWLLRVPNNSDYETIPELPPQYAQPGEWVWDPDDPAERVDVVSPDIPAHLLKPGQRQPHKPSKADGDMLFTLDLDSIEEETSQEVEAAHLAEREESRAGQGSSHNLQESSHNVQKSSRGRHTGSRAIQSSPLRHVFPNNDDHTDQLKLESGLSTLKSHGATIDALSKIIEEEPERDEKIRGLEDRLAMLRTMQKELEEEIKLAQRPKPKLKPKPPQSGLFDGSWQERLEPDELERYSVSIDLPPTNEVGQRWQDQLIADPPASLLGDDLPTSQGIGLGITGHHSPLITDVMRDLTESNGGRQVVEEAFTALTSGSTASPDTPRMKGGFAKSSSPMTPRTEHQAGLFNLKPNIFECPTADEYKSSKSTKTVKTPKFSDIDYKHQSFNPGFELKPTVFEGFKAYNATPKPSPKQGPTPEAATTPTPKTPSPKKKKKPPTSPKKAAATTPKKTASSPRKTESPKKGSGSPKKRSTSPKKETVFDDDSDADAESDDTARNVRLSRRSRKASPPTRAGFRLENTPEKKFALEPVNKKFKARQVSDESDSLAFL